MRRQLGEWVSIYHRWRVDRELPACKTLASKAYAGIITKLGISAS